MARRIKKSYEQIFATIDQSYISATSTVAEEFIYTDINQSPYELDGAHPFDTVVNFTKGEDRINLSGIFSDPSKITIAYEYLDEAQTEIRGAWIQNNDSNFTIYLEGYDFRSEAAGGQGFLTSDDIYFGDRIKTTILDSYIVGEDIPDPYSGDGNNIVFLSSATQIVNLSDEESDIVALGMAGEDENNNILVHTPTSVEKYTINGFDVTKDIIGINLNVFDNVSNLSDITISNPKGKNGSSSIIEVTDANGNGYEIILKGVNNQDITADNFLFAQVRTDSSYSSRNLTGDIDNDYLQGGYGNDILTGGLGVDQLKGDGGADVFVYTSLEDSTTSATDFIEDFETGIDKIDLSATGLTSITITTGDHGQTIITDGDGFAIEANGEVTTDDFIFAS